MTSIVKLVLVGFPNAGKTTLFNHLTGTRYKIGNWSGVTISEHKVAFEMRCQKYELTDVPGILSIYDPDDQVDCLVCKQAIEKADVLINVIDGRHIHRDLVLTLQLLCYEKPVICVVTHEDKMSLLPEKIKALLPCKSIFGKTASLKSIVDLLSEVKVTDVEQMIQWPIGFSLKQSKGVLVERLRASLQQDEQSDIDIAEGFYHTAAEMIDRHGCREPNLEVEQSIDRYILHPFFGILAFLAIVYLMFVVTIGLGGAIGDLLSGVMLLIFDIMPKHYIWQVIVYSMGVGFATCIGFLPILAVMYVFIGYLEQSGYLSRIALLTDGFMRPVGLSGHSFIPLILGFGCNVPAVMATRVISGKNNRILTAIMVPFMSCSARLTIFAIFAASFFPSYGGLVIMGLYLLSVLLGVVTVLMLHYVFRFQESTPLSVLLPQYQWPKWKDIAQSTLLKLKGFVKENLGIIVIASVLLGTLGRVDQTFQLVDGQVSLLSKLGQYSTKWLSFMGIYENNWPAAIALFSGVIAKEVVIVTLNSLYQVSYMVSDGFSASLVVLLNDFFSRLYHLPLQIFLLDWGEVSTHQLYQSYFTTKSALAYMVFVLLYFPCLTTMWALKNEFNLWISAFSFVWSSFLAIWFAKMTYWGVDVWDGLCLLIIFSTMRAVRFYHDAIKT
jgi:ferrous iron transport protein B